jgi:hypothetical protein
MGESVFAAYKFRVAKSRFDSWNEVKGGLQPFEIKPIKAQSDRRTSVTELIQRRPNLRI